VFPWSILHESWKMKLNNVKDAFERMGKYLFSNIKSPSLLNFVYGVENEDEAKEKCK